jgi:lysophospholipase L1-like esterase
MKIAFLGDSLTWGGYGGNYVAEVAKRLPDYTIINAGEGGNTIVNLRRRLDEVLSEQPDGIFVMVGGNDAISQVQPATRPYYEQVQKIPEGVITPELFEQTYRDLLTHIQVAHCLAWVGLPPIEKNPEVVAAVREYNGIATNVARSLNVDTLDLFTPLVPTEIPLRPPLDMASINLIGKRIREKWSDYQAEQDKGGYSFTFDGLHLTPKSAQKVAGLVADFLAQQ